MPAPLPAHCVSLNTAAVLTGRSIRTWQRRIEEGLVPRLGDERGREQRGKRRDAIFHLRHSCVVWGLHTSLGLEVCSCYLMLPGVQLVLQHHEQVSPLPKQDD